MFIYLLLRFITDSENLKMVSRALFSSRSLSRTPSIGQFPDFVQRKVGQGCSI
jgi:hypothetical protein